ncbi:hypothetical protein KR032_010370, partial [Drosophila birchii]
RIVGGDYVPIKDVPWQVAVLWDNQHICGGSIYNQRIILTAAHCIGKKKIANFTVRAGSALKNFEGQLVSVSHVVVHEHYNNKTLKNDVAVMLLASPLELGPTVQPIELAEKSPLPGTEVLVTGWGSLHDKPFQFNLQILLGTNLTIVNRNISKKVILAHAIGRGACFGDSGGPLVTLLDRKLVGIVSGGYRCAGELPEFYTDVAAHKEWINDAIQKLFRQLVSVSHFIVHEHYKYETLENDIAVLLLASPLELGPTVQPIELAENSPPPGTEVLVTGWGSLHDMPFQFNLQILLGTNLTIVNRKSCIEAYASRKYNIPEKVICAQAIGRGTCRGDSGGAVVTLHDRKLVGIVSGALGCAKLPGFYTDVAEYKKWINDAIQQ